MKKVLYHEGFKIESIQDLVPGHLNVFVVTAYDVEDLPIQCDIGARVFSRGTFMAMIYGLLNANKKVQAIKLVKHCGTGWGLREAKEFVDNLIY